MLKQVGASGGLGEEACARAARTFWNMAKLLGLLGLGIGTWGHVVVATWPTRFH